MTPDEHLSQEEISELKQSIGTLESNINKIYSGRRPRELLGDEGILFRTLGVNFEGPNSYIPKYFDKRREKLVDTEFAEVIDALKTYDGNPTIDNRIELLLEVGDILFQNEIITLKHKKNHNYRFVKRQFDSALKYIKTELKQRDLSIKDAQKLVLIKYGTRAWLGSNGYSPKNKPLERQLCVEAYNK